LIVDFGEFGSGGNGMVLLASEVVLAATTTDPVSYGMYELTCNLTCVPIPGKVDGDLPANTTRRSHHESDRFVHTHSEQNKFLDKIKSGWRRS
jgi:hypothetical protein